MPFFAFKLLFAALALILLVLLVFIARQAWRKRPSPPPAATRPGAKAPQQRVGLGRKTPANPVPDPATPPPPRRRQLASFAASEREAAEADAVTLPSVTAAMAEEPDIEGNSQAQAAHAPEPEINADMATTAIVAETSELPVPKPAEFERAVLGRLESAFDAFQAGDVTLDGYRARVLAEEGEVERQIAHHQAKGDAYELEAAIAARESVRWCLDWADEQQRTPED